MSYLRYTTGILLIILTVCTCRGRRIENVVIKGSDTEVNLVLELAEAYMAREPAVSLAISGGGSGLGIAALLNGKTQLANSSRPLTAAEWQLARERSIDVRPIVFAVDALAIIVNRKLPLSAISLDQLARVYAGELTNWRDLGGPNVRISLYGRQNSSGSYTYLRDAVIRREYSSRIRELNGTAQLIEAVSQDPSGIGYVGVGYIRDLPRQGASAPILVLRIQDPATGKQLSPFDTGSIRQAVYPLTRPLYQFTNGEPQGKLKAFIQFELSPEGQQMVASAGYFPVTQAYRKQNQKNGVFE